ncbi:MAG: hypothetical protein NZ108_00185, partial [Bacteroidia bacterium]|nr:hypothetical protein [Bacteroidia bacterium]
MKKGLHKVHKFWWIAIFLFIIAQGNCQNFTIEAIPFSKGDSLIIDFYIQWVNPGQASVPLGNSNFVLNVSDTTSLDFKNKDIDLAYNGPWAGPANPDYLPLSLGGSIFNSVLGPAFINLTVSAVPTQTTGGFLIPNTKTRIGRVRIPILNCSDSLTLSWRQINSGVIYDYNRNSIKQQASFLPLPTITKLCPVTIDSISASPTTICAEQAINLTTFGSFIHNYTYSIGGNLIASGTNSAIQIDTLTSSTNIQVVGFNACGCSDSSQRSITVISAPNFQSIFGDTVCENEDGLISVNFSESGFSYQLYENSTPIGNPIGGNNGLIQFLLPADELNLGFNVFTLQATGFGCTFTVGPIDSILVEDSPDPQILGPNSVVFPAQYQFDVVNATGDYFWALAGGSGTLIPPLTASSVILDLVSTPLTIDTIFSFVTNPNNGCTGVDTFEFQIQSCNPFAGPVAPDTLICRGQRTVVWLDTLNGSIQWQFSGDGINWVNATGLGAQGQVHFTQFLFDTTYYRAIVRDGNCRDTSEVTTVYVDSTSIAGIVSSNDTICINESITLTVSGSRGSIQWQQSPNGLTNWTNVTTGTGFQTATYTTPNLTTTTFYRVKVTGCDSSFSNVIRIHVSPYPRGTFPFPPGNFCAGDLSLPLGATLISGTGRWQSSGNGAFVNQTDPNTTYIAPLGDAGFFTNLSWVVSTPGCMDSVYTQTVQILSPAKGQFPIPPAPICVGDTTAPLGAIAVVGTGRWVALDQNGAASGGFFIPSDTDPNARYVSVAANAGKTIDLLWIVENLPCTPDTVIQPLIVGQTPSGGFPTAPASICVGTSTAPLGAFVTSGFGQWTTDGNGGFNNGSDPNTTYTADIADGGDSITLYWVVSSIGCPSKVYDQKLYVYRPSEGDFPVAPDSICAGAYSAPLGATAIYGTGTWVTTNGQGTFVNPTAGNTVYQSSLLDKNTTVTLLWIVTNGTCKPDTSIQTIYVRTDSIAGSFATAPPPVCMGQTSVPLGATATAGTGTWSHNGFGTFTNPLDPNAQYISSLQDAGSTVTLKWTITTPPCAALVYTQPLQVSPIPDGFIVSTPPPICRGDSTGSLQAVTIRGVGRWEENGVGYVSNPSSPTAHYVSALQDSNQTIQLHWIIESGACPADTNTVTLQINGYPIGDFSTVLPDICAGSPTIPLGAVVTQGQLTWSSNGQGYFSHINQPNAVYTSVIADANSTVNITATISSIGCDTISFTRPVFVTPSPAVEGYFNTILPPICAGDTTISLGAQVISGTPAWSTIPPGIGSFSNVNDPNAVYYSELTGPDTILIVFTVTNASCNPLEITQPLVVNKPPAGAILTSPDTICAGTVSDTIRATDVVGTGIWKVFNNQGGVSSLVDTAIVYISSLLDGGNQIHLNWIVRNGVCKPDTVRDTLWVDARPSGDFPSAIPPICAGSPSDTIFATLTTGSGQWLTTGLGTFSNQTAPTTVYTTSPLDAGGTDTLFYIVRNGVCTPDTNFQVISVLNSVVDGDFSIAPPPICAGTPSAQLNATLISGFGSWSDNGAGGIFVNPTSPTSVYIPPASAAGDTVFLTWSISNLGCNPKVFTQPLIVNNPANGAFPIAPAPICVGDTTDTLFATTFNGIGHWETSGTGTFTSINSDTTLYIPAITDAPSVILRWVVDIAGCESDTNAHILNVFAPQAGSFTTQLDSICVGQLSQPLGATVTVGTGQWSTTNGSGGFTSPTSNPNAAYIAIQADGDSLVELVWTITNGTCDTLRFTQSIQVNGPPQGDFPTIIPGICEADTSIPLGATIIRGGGYWHATGPGYFIDPTDPNTQFVSGNVNRDTTFSLIWRIGNGKCDSIAISKPVTVYATPEGVI